jgi:hypothetical protein
MQGAQQILSRWIFYEAIKGLSGPSPVIDLKEKTP